MQPPSEFARKNTERSGRLMGSVVRIMAAYPTPRKVLNALYSRLGPARRQGFHREFSKLFLTGQTRGHSGQWKVRFVDRSILMPLTPETFWLDWDTAISIIGHDIEVKQTYKALLESPEHRPEIFVDIGANYGTHSLLFLAHNIPTITFEPNSSCHPAIFRACTLNGLTPRIEHTALGKNSGHIELIYPKQETWLGSTNSQTIKGLDSSRDLISETVEQKPLDKYLPELDGRRALIKIDTEGNELNVLQGAMGVLQRTKAMVVFESSSPDQRPDLFAFFESLGYSICDLPWSSKSDPNRLTLDGFVASTRENFLGVADAR